MLTKEQAAFLLEVLGTPGLSLPVGDPKKMLLAVETHAALSQIASHDA